MKAYVMTGPGKLDIEERSLPQLAAQEVLVKVCQVGLCGSDLHLYRGNYNGPRRYPILFGHEWSGIVTEIGHNVTRVQIGDHVTSDCSRYCGICPTCKSDRNLCSSIEKFGITIDGASSDYVVRDEKYLYKADPDLDLALLALTEPISVANHLLEKMIRTTGPFADKKILIYGGGPIGLSALLLLKGLYNCQQVDMWDINEYRMQIGANLGATPARLDLFQQPDLNDYASLYGNSLYDVVIETSGSAPAFTDAFSLLRPMGVLGCLGMMQKVEIPQSQIVTKSLTVIGTIGATGGFEEVITFLKANPEKASQLISHRFSIHEYRQAFETAIAGNQTMKILLSI